MYIPFEVDSQMIKGGIIFKSTDKSIQDILFDKVLQRK